jgi:hypothetical protein
MIAANEPGGGGLDGVAEAAAVGLVGTFCPGATFVVADKLGLGVGFVGAGLELAVVAGLGPILGAADGTAGLVASEDFIAAELFATLFSGFAGRGSWSSALRLIPPPTLPPVGGA